MKIAVFGGSFNPVHNGHIKIVKFIQNELGFDKILIIPTGNPSHKRDYLVTDSQRLEMCRLAFENFENVEISSIETDSQEVSYTIDTLRKLKTIYPNGEFFEIIGEDSAKYFQKWKNFRDILKESTVVVLKRIGNSGEYTEILPEIKEKMVFLNSPYFNYSSTEIREALEKKQAGYQDKIKELLPLKVITYIKENKMYS